MQVDTGELLGEARFSLIHRLGNLIEQDCTAARRHCVIHSVGSAPEQQTYAEIWRMAGKIRCSLRDLGLVRGQVLALASPARSATLPVLLAAWAEGIAICFLPHDISDKTGRMAPATFRIMLQIITPALVLGEADILELAASCGTPHTLTLDSLIHSAQNALPLSANATVLAEMGDTAVLQFTSGSSGLPKAAVITHAMRAANCAAIAARVMVNGHDRMVSWLPLNHDMGLSAITLALWSGIDLVLIPTPLYARQPLIWLDAMTAYGGTLSPAPASAYELIARFAAMVGKRHPDLSAWRYGWAGAEPVFDHVLQTFQTLMAPYGLRPDVVQPAYGMAETVVATTLNPPGHPYRTVCVSTQALETTGRVQGCDTPSADTTTFVSNGRPVDGIHLRVLDQEGQCLPAGEIGRLQVSGSSVIRQYLGHQNRAVCPDGWYDTGDIGFLQDGEVFVSGRAKDIIIRGGRNISPYQVERAIEQRLSLRPGSVGVFSTIDMSRSSERVWAVIGCNTATARLDLLRTVVAKTAISEVGLQLDEICFIASAALPKTTSGKIQRHALRLMYR